MRFVRYLVVVFLRRSHLNLEYLGLAKNCNPEITIFINAHAVREAVYILHIADNTSIACNFRYIFLIYRSYYSRKMMHRLYEIGLNLTDIPTVQVVIKGVHAECKGINIVHCTVVRRPCQAV